MIATAFPTRTRRALASVLTAVLLAATALLVTAAPASAHDELVSSDPAADSTVETLPAQITLTYSAELLSDETSSVVEVTDSAGTPLSDGAPTVAGSVVTQEISPGAPGTISVAWRVVSSDGHPISGEFSFVAAEAAAPAPTEEATPEPTATPTAAEPVPTATATTEPVETADADDTSDGGILPWVIGTVVLLAVIGLIVWLLGARARQQKRAQQERTAGRDG